MKESKMKKGSSRADAAEHEDSTDIQDYLFFYMPDTIHGEFCQLFPSTFTVDKTHISSLIGHTIDNNTDNTNTGTSASDSITFTCAEQFMMCCKAMRFHDHTTAQLILASPSPKEHKRLGKPTTNFTAESWDEVKSAVVLAGSLAKFRQNEKLRGKLMGTGERVLVEAASRDRVWGIGYTEKHALRFKKHWGENRLGRT